MLQFRNLTANDYELSLPLLLYRRLPSTERLPEGPYDHIFKAISDASCSSFGACLLVIFTPPSPKNPTNFFSTHAQPITNFPGGHIKAHADLDELIQLSCSHRYWRRRAEYLPGTENMARERIEEAERELDREAYQLSSKHGGIKLSAG